MNNYMEDYDICKDESTEILGSAFLTFEENLIANDSNGCEPYGCTCIAYERCCGCFIQ